MSRSTSGGRHELGQNHLVDRRVIRAMVDAVAATDGTIVEIGPGGGALTVPLARLGRPLVAVELDPRRARTLAARLPGARVVASDFLTFRPLSQPHVLVGNLPFSTTTAVLRRVLAQERWTSAVLLVQWEVARRRAGVGGASLMTVESWPWFEFRLLRRVPAAAFRPVPAVDGGLLIIRRRAVPLIPSEGRHHYRRLVAAVFRAPGQDIGSAARRAGLDRALVRRWLHVAGVPPGAHAKDVGVEAWVTLFDLTRPRGFRGGSG